MRRIPGKDAIFLWSETETTHMQIAFAGVFDPSTIPGEPVGPGDVYARFRSLLEQRIHLVPQFRQRVVEVPMGLDNPYFVDDPHFDLDYHLRRIALPAPGERQQLEEFVGRLVSRPMDRNRPLWEIYVVEGVQGDKWAYVAKAHHVLVDGVGGNEMLVNLLDLEPEMRTVEPPDEPFDPKPLPGPVELLTAAALGTARKPMRFVGTARRTVEVAADFAKWAVTKRDEHLEVIGPNTFLNGPVGPHRQVRFGRFPLADVKVVKGAVGCTVNDVVLAVVGRGLRRFLRDHGVDPQESLVAAVPISVRPKGDTSVENHVAGMTVSMHDHLEDLGEQLAAISRSTGPAKEQIGAVSATFLTDWTEYAPPAVAAQAIRFYTRMGLSRTHPPIANLTISNVPGPPFPLYLAGSRMESMYPIGPVVTGQRLNITVVSYQDTMFIGAIADRDDVPDCRGLVDAVIDEVERAREYAEKLEANRPAIDL
ncbi:MAG: wax ester/triacylglycerol synthase family O-acyltransferase, partial [Nitriliruptorales bacterium]|nr:wax ester/triacylglycerol synthase family O-acyltransferase [Nitriliruptorales bacterium]